MIKTLQKKFVFTAMISISMLLTVLLGAINIFNVCYNAKQSDYLLEMIAYEEANPLMPMIPVKPGGNEFFGITEEARRSAAYFTVYTDNEGNILAADVSNIRSVTQEAAQKIARRISQGSKGGRVESYKYTSVQNINGYVKAYIFLDTYSQNMAVLTVLLLSVFIGAVCWGLMLLPVSWLSKKAIKPIAENIEKQKRFVTDAGHEIKTPLAIIMANTEAMELHTGENKGSRNIKAQTKRLDILTKNMLTLAKAEESGTSIPEEDVDISLCVYEQTEMFRESAEMKSISLTAEIQPDVIVKANGEYISRIVSVLLDNSVKYTQENGKIEVELQQSGKGFSLRVANTYNEAETDTERFFDRFYRKDSARTQSGGGYGIGLSAARAIVGMYKGRIDAEVKNGMIIFTVKI